MLDLDISLIGVFVLVGLLMVVLNRLYYKPIGRVLAEREEKVTNENQQIESNLVDIEKKTLHIEEVLKKTNKESRKMKEELIQEGEGHRSKILENAREESKKIYKDKMKQLDKEIQLAEEKLEKDIKLFSDKLKDIFMT